MPVGALGDPQRLGPVAGHQHPVPVALQHPGREPQVRPEVRGEAPLNRHRLEDPLRVRRTDARVQRPCREPFAHVCECVHGGVHREEVHVHDGRPHSGEMTFGTSAEVRFHRCPEHPVRHVPRPRAQRGDARRAQIPFREGRGGPELPRIGVNRVEITLRSEGFEQVLRDAHVLAVVLDVLRGDWPGVLPFCFKFPYCKA